MEQANYETIIARLDAIEKKLKGLEVGSESKTAKKPKRIVKPKDPNAPKNPSNWYFLMRQDISKQVDKEGLSKEEANKKKAELLVKMKDDKKTKEKFEKEAEKLREKFNKEKEAYEKNKVKKLADKCDSDDDDTQKEDKVPVKDGKKPAFSDSDTSTSKKKRTKKAKSESESSDTDIEKKISKKRNAELAKINALANSPSDESD